MDATTLEFLVKKTPYSNLLFFNAWDGFSTGEKIEILLYIKAKPNAFIPEKLLKKALADSNATVRTLAIYCSYGISEKDNPELFKQIMSDPSPLVKAAIHKGRWVLGKDEWKQYSHIERLTILESDTTCIGHYFPELIMEALNNHTMTEDEAQELLLEFVNNTKLMEGVSQKSSDGLDWHSRKQDFEAVWKLTTCTPLKVHYVIALKYPLYSGDRDPIPEEFLYNMEPRVHDEIIYRGYEPLIIAVQKFPEKFHESVVDYLKYYL